jgi:hypothetical protein
LLTRSRVQGDGDVGSADPRKGGRTQSRRFPYETQSRRETCNPATPGSVETRAAEGGDKGGRVSGIKAE